MPGADTVYHPVPSAGYIVRSSEGTGVLLQNVNMIFKIPQDSVIKAKDPVGAKNLPHFHIKHTLKLSIQAIGYH